MEKQREEWGIEREIGNSETDRGNGQVEGGLQWEMQLQIQEFEIRDNGAVRNTNTETGIKKERRQGCSGKYKHRDRNWKRKDTFTVGNTNIETGIKKVDTRVQLEIQV
ncbi:hypothetical protein CHS0354_024754 [Potamilus streckersoni]|uniref:Uncharacterized protein n=1 Tax=Potamilus streckersoni TaxID=2493646 RepID=A0AAE0RWY3_9BIVA|nr:hypothetical protein CHS0354_024754 [Potamilus streckersoni]